MVTILEERRDLAEAIGIDRLFLKREDLQPTGSFKERAARRQIEHLVERGKKTAVVSSSGNAAIALAQEARDQGVKLFALVSPDLSGEKLETLLSFHPVVIQSHRAMRLANYLSAHHHVPNLRPSVDDHAILGFVSLGEEIDEQMSAFTSEAPIVVSFMTSGASLLGMAQGYRRVPRPRFVAVTHEGVGAMGTSRGRREEVSKIADIFVVETEALKEAQNLLNKHGLAMAPEAVASFAWVLKEKPRGNVVWVVSGKAWKMENGKWKMSSRAGSGSAGENGIVNQAETFEEIDDIYEST